MAKIKQIAKDTIKDLSGIIKSLEKAQNDIRRGRDPFGNVDSAFANLNRIHGQMDEGELSLGKSDEDIHKVAEELYDNGDARREAFDEAYSLYPACNDGGADTDEAEEYILDRLMQSMEQDKKHGGIVGWTEKELDALRSELSEMIYAGLT